MTLISDMSVGSICLIVTVCVVNVKYKKRQIEKMSGLLESKDIGERVSPVKIHPSI